MKLIVGLGNPGKEYSKTRHNCGFMCIDKYVNSKNLDFKTKFNGEYVETIINGEKIILVKPLTYMNLSGECVLKFCKYYNIDNKDILVIYDDVDFEVGHFKIKKNGSSAGHNGIKNIMDLLDTEKISRVRIGISKNDYDKKDYVTGKFNKKQLEIINKVTTKVCNIIEDFSIFDVEKLMEKYNKDGNEGETL